MQDGWGVPNNERGVRSPEDFVLDQTLDRAIERLESVSRGTPGLTKKRLGSSMSDKQMARAAVEGRKIIFCTGVLTPMEGYVVGMDDYHWLIAAPSEGERGVQTTLVHKSCPLVTFTADLLSGEIDEDREKIQSIGHSFWRYCVDNGLSRPTTIN
jgi:hypothetical protein